MIEVEPIIHLSAVRQNQMSEESITIFIFIFELCSNKKVSVMVFMLFIPYTLAQPYLLHEQNEPGYFSRPIFSNTCMSSSSLIFLLATSSSYSLLASNNSISLCIRLDSCFCCSSSNALIR